MIFMQSKPKLMEIDVLEAQSDTTNISSDIKFSMPYNEV